MERSHASTLDVSTLTIQFECIGMPREVKQAQTRLYRPGKRAVQNKKPNMIYMRSHKQLDKPDLTDSQWILAQSQNDRARNG